MRFIGRLILVVIATSQLTFCASSQSKREVTSEQVSVEEMNPTLEPLFPEARTFGSPDPVHVLKKNETLWFLANIYYQDPHRYTDILKNNGLKSLNDVKPGQKLKMIEPYHSPDDEGFQARYDRLFLDRAVKLAAIKNQKMQDLAKAKSLAPMRSVASEPPKKIKKPSRAVR